MNWRKKNETTPIIKRFKKEDWVDIEVIGETYTATLAVKEVLQKYPHIAEYDVTTLEAALSYDSPEASPILCIEVSQNRKEEEK